MKTPELIIFDVGHGNCALLKDTKGNVLVDCPPGSTLVEALHELEITEISHLLISHADQDHIAGLPQLLLDENININNIHLNSDWLRDTEIWKDILYALQDARQRFGINIEAQLTTSTTNRLNVGETNIKILAPTPELALSGVGGKELIGKKTLTANTISAVVSLSYRDRQVAILAGDLDKVGLDSLVEEKEDLNAEILIFPHHGGRPGNASGKEFSKRLCDLVKPRLVIFSIDRSLHHNPRNEIIEGVRESNPDTHIMCTQLSLKCSTDLGIEDPKHLYNLPAKGRTDKKCCGGTIVIRFENQFTDMTPSIEAHREFIDQFQLPLCRQFQLVTKTG